MCGRTQNSPVSHVLPSGVGYILAGRGKMKMMMITTKKGYQGYNAVLTKTYGKPSVKSLKAVIVCTRVFVVLKSFVLVPSLFLIPCRGRNIINKLIANCRDTLNIEKINDTPIKGVNSIYSI